MIPQFLSEPNKYGYVLICDVLESKASIMSIHMIECSEHIGSKLKKCRYISTKNLVIQIIR